MSRTLLLTTTAILVLGLAGQTFAQPIGRSDEAAPSDAQREMNALQDMNNATSDVLNQKNKQIAMMQEYLKEQGMLADFENGNHGDTNQDGQVNSSDVPFQLSFNQALGVAEQHEVSLYRESESQTPDERRTSAYREVVKSSWDHLHQKMSEVNAMSEYLSEKGKFDDYQEWAKQKNAEEQVAFEKDAAAKSKAAVDEQETKEEAAKKLLSARKAELKKAHEEFLKTAWDHYKFNEEEYTKRYKYASKYKNGNYNGYGGGYGGNGYGGW